MLKTLANQKRLRRRHTVGGTKDFADWEQIIRANAKSNRDNRSAWDRLEPVTNDQELNVNRSLQTWLQGQKERMRTSSPDLMGLTIEERRLSLPDAVMAAEMKMPSLLESQV